MKAKIVYGCPCSGKTTYVKENAGEQDIIFDYDQMLLATTNRKNHQATNHALHFSILKMREPMIEISKQEKNCKTFWLVCSWVTEKMKEMLKGVETEEIFIKATKEECYEHLECDEMRTDKEEWKKIIEKWFKKHEREDEKMKKSVEMKKKIEKMRNEIVEAEKENLEKAAELAEQLNELMKQYKVQKTLEESETPDNEAEEDEEEEESDTKNHVSFVPLNKYGTEKKARIRNRAFNKLIFGKSLTAEEKQAYWNDGSDTTVIGQIGGTNSKGGYIVPIEQMGILREYQKSYVQLKKYCHVVTAQSRSGNFPTLGDETGVLVNFSEMSQIKESDFDFGQVQYTISDYGDLIPISNTLIEDTNINILEVVGRRLMRKTVNTENKKILELLATLTGKSISGYKDLTKCLNVSLDPVYYAGAKIITNQDGFQWMSELEDENKRPLMLPDVTEAETYKVIVLPNSQLPTSSKKIPMYVGNLGDYCIFFERKEIEIATSTEYKFGLNATALRCITRFGVSKDDSDAMLKLEITTT